MLYIDIPSCEFWDELAGEFITVKGRRLQLEHSLVSLSKWEAIWKKPFLSMRREDWTLEMVSSYISCMTITQNVDPLVYMAVNTEIIQKVFSYMDETMTATTFSDNPNAKKSRTPVTAEIIYYWMIELGIPWECQKWHLNRLLTLIKVCNIKQQPAKKMSKQEAAAQRRSLNAARKGRH